MSRKIARITQEKKLLLADEIIEDNRYSLSEHGKLYTKNILEGSKFSIDEEFIEVGEFIEGYPFVKPVIDDSLVLWLDGSTGNNYDKTKVWEDLSGNGNDGELRNFGYGEGSGWTGEGLEFDGVDDCVDILDNEIFNLQDMTVTYVFTPYYLSGTQQFIIRSGGWRIYRNGHWAEGEIAFLVYYVKLDGSIGWNLLNVYPRLNEPIHLTGITTSAGQVLLYVNGEIKREVFNSSFSYWRNATGNIRLGETASCRIHLACIYNRALSPEEVLQNYQAGQCSPLLVMRGEVIG